MRSAFPMLPASVVENASLALRHNFKECARALDEAFPGTRAVDDEVSESMRGWRWGK